MSELERIAFDARYINDRYHGIGRYAFRLLEAMLSISTRSMPELHFVIYTGNEKDSRFDWHVLQLQSNVEFQAGPWPLYWPHEQFLWKRFLERNRIDLFYSPYFIAPLLTNIPSIVTVHDLIFDRFPEYMPRRWGRPYYSFLMRWSTQKARRVVAISRATAGDLQIFYGVPPEKVIIVPEGVESAFGPSEDRQLLEDIRRRYALKEGFILSVGARRPHKNLANLVRAFATLSPELAPQLVFAGQADPRFPDHARQMAEQMKLNGRVRFLGWIPEVDLPTLYASAAVVVIPSLVEGFGLPALEAMACGAPLIASNSSSLPEVAGDAGILLDPYDIDAWAGAMTEVLRNEDQRVEMSAAGRKRARRFTWQRAANALLDLFTQTRS